MQHWRLQTIPDDGNETGSSPLEPLPPDFPTALLYGWSVFTTFRHPITPGILALHTDRLCKNGEALGFNIPGGSEFLTSQVQKALAQVPPDPAAIRLTLLPDIQHFTDLLQNTETQSPAVLFLSLSDLPPAATTSLALKAVRYERPLPLIKHGQYLEDFLKRKEAFQEGMDDILRVNSSGSLAEASTSNVFALRDQILYTPQPERDGCLSGITRGRILAVAPHLGLTVSPDALDESLLAEMDGVFLTNAVQGIRPVARIQTTGDQQISFPWPDSALKTMKRLKALLSH